MIFGNAEAFELSVAFSQFENPSHFCLKQYNDENGILWAWAKCFTEVTFKVWPRILVYRKVV